MGGSLSWRVAVPAAPVQALLCGVAAIALAWGLAKPSPNQPSWFPFLAIPTLLLAAIAALWCGLLTGRIHLRGDQIRVFGVYRVRSFPIDSIAGLEVVAGRWPERGSPVVLPVRLEADYLRVGFADDRSYEPPGFCSLGHRRGHRGSMRATVDEVNGHLAASREDQR